MKPSKKYPEKIFSALDFIKEIRENLKVFDRTKTLLLDLSNDISVTSRCVELIVHQLNHMGIDKFSLDLSSTSIDANVLDIFQNEKNIELMNICDTEAARSDLLDDVDNVLIISYSRKLIFMSEEELQFLDDDSLDKSFMKNHINYYKKINRSPKLLKC